MKRQVEFIFCSTCLLHDQSLVGKATVAEILRIAVLSVELSVPVTRVRVGLERRHIAQTKGHKKVHQATNL